MKSPLIALLAFCLHLSSAVAEKKLPKAASLYFPPAEGAWEKVNPAKVGWDLAKLKEAIAYAGENKSSGAFALGFGHSFLSPSGNVGTTNVGTGTGFQINVGTRKLCYGIAQNYHGT